MNMKNYLVPLLAIVIAAAVLLGANIGLSEMRAANIQAEHVGMMRLLLPGSENFVREAYTGEDANIRSVHKAENGFVIETAVQGYVDEIVMMIGVNNDGRVTGLVVRDMDETIGLGARALTDHEFLAQMLNTSGDLTVGTAADAFTSATSASEEGSVPVDAITGATVTSKAVVRSVNSAVAFVTGADVASSATEWGG